MLSREDASLREQAEADAQKQPHQHCQQTCADPGLGPEHAPAVMSCSESCKGGRDSLVVEDLLPQPQPQLQSLNVEQQRALALVPWVRKISCRRRGPVLANTFSSVMGKWAFKCNVCDKIM